jgi:hypothetical protein
MKSLQLIVTLPTRHEASLDIAHVAAPSLLKLLKRGQIVTHEESQAGTLCGAFGIKAQHDWPLAAIGAQAEAIEGAAHHYWLRLDPVHLEVTMGGLILHSAESLGLSWQCAQALIADINQHRQGEGWHIHAATPTRWYLCLPHTSDPHFPDLYTTPLDQMQGEYLTPHLPRGKDARYFLKQINEAQMLMHAHPVNQKRESEGQPTVNGLWLWGGGILPERCPPLDQVAGDDFELHALARHSGSAVVTQVNTYSDLRHKGNALVLLKPSDPGPEYDPVTHLAQLEENWFAPLLKQLIWGRIRHVRLDLIGHRSVSVTPHQARQFWR